MEVNVDIDNGGSSLPSNYVTIHDLKQRWLQQQQQKPSSNTQMKLNLKSNENDAASKTSNDVVSRSGNEFQSPPTPEVERKLFNDSKTLIRVSNEERQTSIINNNKQSWNKNSSRAPRNPRFITNQIPTGETAQLESEPVVETKKTRNENDAASKTSNDAVSRSGNVLKSPPTPEVERKVLNDSKTVIRVSNEEHQISINNNKQLRNKNSSRAPRNPRFITNQIPAVETAQPESEPAEEMKTTKKKKKKKQYRNRNPTKVDELNDEMVPIVEDENVVEEMKKQQSVREGEHRNPNRNVNQKEVRESKHLTAPVVDQNVVHEVVAAAAAVKEINVINVSEVNNRSRRGGSSSGSGNGRFQGSNYRPWKSPYLENTKGKMTQSWVKKGESVQIWVKKEESVPNSCI